MEISETVDGRGQDSARRRPAAFTLTEILVVMAMLSFIVLGLMAMFHQTQRAFRAGLMQTDILESGRLATDLLGRELEQVTPSFSFRNDAPNFYTEMQNLGEGQLNTIQALPTSRREIWRTNVMHDLFFVTHENQTWTGIGYFARTNRMAGTGAGAVCTLYRFQMSGADNQYQAAPYQIFTNFNYARQVTNELSTVSRIMDGVVHFRVRACDEQGWVIPFNPAWQRYTNLPSAILASNLITGWFDQPSGEYTSYWFLSNAAPAYVELEIGILEQQTLERYKSLPVPSAQYRFFTNSSVTAHTHLFRQRVSVRNVDLSAFYSTNAIPLFQKTGRYRAQAAGSRPQPGSLPYK